MRTRLAYEKTFLPICASFSLKELVCFRPSGCGEAMAVARNLWGYIDRRDHRLMRRMNRWRAPPWVRVWVIAATAMGGGWVWDRPGLVLVADGRPQPPSANGSPGAGASLGVLGFQGALK